MPSSKLIGKLGLTIPQLLMVSLALTLIGIGAYGTVQLIKQRYQHTLENSLTTVLKATTEGISHWREDQYLLAQNLARSQSLIEAAQELLAVPRQQSPLLAADAQQRLRRMMRPYLEHYRGYFLIAPDNISLASSGDSNVGSRNLLTGHPALLARLWNGETRMTQLLLSDVPLKTEIERQPQLGDETLFVGTPVRDDKGRVIVLLTLRIDPYETLFSLVQQGWLGRTGESYFFDRNGLLLSHSRFEEQLARIGLLEPGQSSALHLQIRDPGVDLTQLKQSPGRADDLPLTRMAASAVNGTEGVDVAGYRDYRGVPVVGAWYWDDRLGVGIATEQDVTEAYALFYFVRSLIYGGCALGVLALFALVWVFVSGKERLSQLQIRLQAIVETAIDGIVVIDERGVIESVNPAMESIFGYAMQEMIGNNVSMLMPQPHRTQHNDYIARYQQSGEAKVVGIRREVEGRRKDGHLFPIELGVNRLEISRGLHFSGVIHDISERKRAELALEQERDFTRDVLDSLTAHIVVLDDTGRIVLANMAWKDFARSIGLSVDYSGGGVNYFDVVRQVAGPESEEAVEITSRIREMLAGGRKSFSLEYSCHCSEEKQWFQIRANHFLHRDRSAVVVSNMDITLRKESELQLRSLNDQMHITQLALDRTGIGELWLDAQDGHIVYVNERICEHLGYDREEMLGLRVPDFDAQFTKEEIKEIIRHLKKEGWKRFETVHLTKQGRRVPVEVIAMHMANREGSGIVITFTIDITERKEAEKAILQAREEAEEANRAKSTFLATMSHEIRTPLNGVVGTIDMLAHLGLDPHQQDLVATAQDSAILLQGIIDDILDFSKIEAGRLELEQVPVTLEPLVERLGENLQHIAQSRGVELLLYIDPTVPQVKGDPVRLRQILYNLAGNAIKFSGDLPDRTGRAMISVILEGRASGKATLCLKVSDNGIGMSPEVQSRLFKPFVQGEEETTRRFGGSGLGLVITQCLVERMEGRIELESTEGAGSTFTVHVTLDEAAGPMPIEASNLEGIKVVLLTRDEAGCILSNYLRHAGAEVLRHEADDLVEACRRQCTDSGELVVVIDTCGERQQSAVLRDTLRREINNIDLRFLTVERGRRRYVRPAEGDGLILDLNAMRRHSLLNAVAVLAGRESPEQERVVPQQLAQDIPLSVDEARRQGRLLLLADDNPTNRKVISQQLSMLGYLAEVAADGAEALAMWRIGDYGMLLTDCHMPVMDGYQLSTTIRREESAGSRKPIVAITADALKGTAQKCFASGMDDYLTKPLQLHQLGEMLDRWLPTDRVKEEIAAESPAMEVQDVSDGAIDPHALGRLLGTQEPEILADYYNDFLQTSTPTAEQMEIAFRKKDLSAVSRLAHKLKSSARTVGANGLADCCLALETAGKEADVQAVSRQMELFPGLFRRVREWIEDYCKIM